MIFDCEAVETRGEDGALQSAGMRWTEARGFWESAVHFIGDMMFYLGLVAIGAGLLAPLFKSGMPMLVVAGVILVCVAWGLYWLGWRVPGRKRELTFWRDGLGFAPFGLSTWAAHHDRLKWPHTEINTIEAEQVVFPKVGQGTIYTHGVRIFFKGGQIAHVAKHLEPDDAHMLGVRLTHARLALGDDVTLATIRSAPSHPGRGKSGEILID